MNVPTRDDLARLLWSDPASEAWEGDARGELAGAASKAAVLEAAQRLLDVISAESADVSQGMSLEGTSARDDLREVATTCKRLAILCLHAGWAAEQKAAGGGGERASRRPRDTDAGQTSLDLNPTGGS